MPLVGVSQGGAGRASAGGASAGGAGAEGLDLNDLMDYVGRAFGSANAEVSAVHACLTAWLEQGLLQCMR